MKSIEASLQKNNNNHIKNMQKMCVFFAVFYPKATVKYIHN